MFPSASVFSPSVASAGLSGLLGPAWAQQHSTGLSAAGNRDWVCWMRTETELDKALAWAETSYACQCWATGTEFLGPGPPSALDANKAGLPWWDGAEPRPSKIQTPGTWGQSLVFVPASVNLSTPSHLPMHGPQNAVLQTPQEPMSTA